MTPELEQRLMDLLDKQDILECLHRYCRGMDRMDKTLLLSAYHPDAIDDHGAFVGTPEEFWNFYSSWHLENNRAHHHHISNSTIELSGNTAHSETYWHFQAFNPDDTITMSCGRYVDRLEKRSGEWKIAARSCLIEWTGTLRDVETSAEAAAVAAAAGTSSRDRNDMSYQRPLQISRPRSLA